MKTYNQLLNEWAWNEPQQGHSVGRWNGSYGHKIGGQVKINLPGHENHGKVGTIHRQQGVEYGVELPGNREKLHWHNAGDLQQVHEKEVHEKESHPEFWKTVDDLKTRTVKDKQCPSCGKRAFHKPDCPALKKAYNTLRSPDFSEHDNGDY